MPHNVCSLFLSRQEKAGGDQVGLGIDEAEAVVSKVILGARLVLHVVIQNDRRGLQNGRNWGCIRFRSQILCTLQWVRQRMSNNRASSPPPPSPH